MSKATREELINAITSQIGKAKSQFALANRVKLKM